MEKSNSYIFIYSVVMVVVIATLLSVAAFFLKGPQQANVKVEKMQNILAAVKIEAGSDAENLFNEKLNEFFFVKKGTAEKVSAESINQTDMFNLVNDGENLPVYDINDSYVIPLNGNGLWGPIWGYISISKEDNNTVVGTVFDHQGETAGLGAEIKKPKFCTKFEGKKIFAGNEFSSVKIVKGGAKTENEVDAISGSTKTCDGVAEMLFDCLEGYVAFFQAAAGVAPVAEPAAEAVEETAATEESEKEVESKNE